MNEGIKARDSLASVAGKSGVMSAAVNDCHASADARGIEAESQIPSRFQTTVTDRLYYCMRRLNSGYHYVVLFMDGRIDEERLARSVRLTVDAEPLLGCRFVDDWFRPYWERRCDLEEVEFLRLERQWDRQAQLNRFMNEPCDPRYDLQFKVLVLRGETDTICLQLNHMLGDAAAIKDLVYLLASVYNRLGESPSYQPMPNLGSDRSFRAIGGELRWRDRLAIVKNQRWPIRELRRSGASWQFPIPDANAEQGNFEILTLPPERGQKIIRYAQKHQASVNLVLITAFFRALEAVVRPSPDVPLPVIITVDLRRHLASKKTDMLCNMSGAEILFARAAGPKTPFRDILMQFREQFEVFRRQYLGLSSICLIPLVLETFPVISALYPYVPFGLIKSAFNLGMSRPGVSGIAAFLNVGKVEPDRSRFGDVGVHNAYLSWTISRVPGLLALNAAYFRNAININVRYMDNCLLQSTVRSVLVQMERELP